MTGNEKLECQEFGSDSLVVVLREASDWLRRVDFVAYVVDVATFSVGHYWLVHLYYRRKATA